MGGFYFCVFYPFLVEYPTMKDIKTNVKKLEHSRVEIAVTIPADRIAEYRSKAIAGISETIKIDGFRPGKVPESKIIEKIGETGLLAEMADLALTDAYPEIIQQSKTQPISRPEITITKLAPGNDVEYTITTDVMPTIELRDVKKIAEEKNKAAITTEVTDEDVTKAIKEIRQMRAHEKMHEDGVDHHDHNHQNIDDANLPELTDEFVKTLGDFTDVADFTAKLKENLQKEQENRAHEKRRIEIIEAIIAQGTFDIPASMIDFELNKMLEQFNYDLAMQGMKMDEYLGHIGKTIEEIKTEWRDQAVKRVHMQMTLEKIAEEFSVKPDQVKIDEQVKQIMAMYQDQAVEEANVVTYVTQIQTNAAVFDWLEAQK